MLGNGVAASPAFTTAEAARYHAVGWWSQTTLSDMVRRNAEQLPDRHAYIDYPGPGVTWRQVNAMAQAWAARLAAAGVRAGARIAVWHRDAADIHTLFVAIERCGAIVVGIGARAGTREVAAILSASQAQLLITDDQRRCTADELGITTLSVADLNEQEADLPPDSQLGADDVFLINSTSGTTGLPKCVVHTQNRWYYFHQLAVANARLCPEDIFLPVIPTPFGFGLWTSHTTPIHLGATAVLLDQFSVAATCAAIERHRVTVLCCVSTQLTMIMADRVSSEHDLSSLRVVFTGGEALPYRPAAAFEELSGAKILQFYGSNETGVLSATTVDDPQERRLRTSGRIVADMSVRLFGGTDGTTDVTDTGRGQPACRGPATSLGYLDGSDHDQLFTADGWMRMGDLCEIDDDGYVRVTGRTSDFILRGGKNISAVQVEEAVMSHPAVALAAAVPIRDAVFGERVCVYLECLDTTLELAELVEYLLAQGVSKELLPERLVVVDELPRSSGGKIAKGQLREIEARGVAAGDDVGGVR